MLKGTQYQYLKIFVQITPTSNKEINVCFEINFESNLYIFSHSTGEKFKFTLGRGHVPKIWDLGIATMSLGEVASFSVQSKDAIGKLFEGFNFPKNSILKFEIELCKIYI